MSAPRALILSSVPASAPDAPASMAATARTVREKRIGRLPFFAWGRRTAGAPDDRHIVAAFPAESQFVHFARRPKPARFGARPKYGSIRRSPCDGIDLSA